MTKELELKEYATKCFEKGYLLYIYFSSAGYYKFKPVDPKCYVDIEKFKEKYAYGKKLYSSYEEVMSELQKLNKNFVTYQLEQKAKQSFEKYAPTDEDYVVSPYSEDEGRKILMFNNEYGAEEEYERLYTKGYIAGATENGIQWHKVEDGDLPQPKGKYEHQNYPHIPCLVEFVHFDYGVRYWNVKEQCWDDEECDDYYCEAEQVKRWCYLDDLIKE